MANLQQAADKVTTDLMQYGLAGAVLATLVAPVLYVLVKSSQKREEDRSKHDEQERQRQALREDRLLSTLQQSVDQQGKALEAQRAFEVGEQAIHHSLTTTLKDVSDKLQAQGEKTNVMLARIAENLQESTQVLRGLRNRKDE